MTDDKRRAPTSSDDRALVGRNRRRSSPLGVPIAPAEDRGQFTPVTDLLDRIHDPEVRWSIRMVWEHTANIEMRLKAQIEASDAAHLESSVTALTKAIVDISGIGGTNGKLGALKARVDTLSSKAWLLLAAFVGGIGAAAIKLIVVVRAFDAVEARGDRSADEIKILQAQVMTLQTALIARHSVPAAPAESN